MAEEAIDARDFTARLHRRRTEPDAPRTGMADSTWSRLAVILGLTGFAIVQPMLALMGDNPMVVADYEVRGPALVLFALTVAVIPALVLWSVPTLVGVVHRGTGWLLHLGVVAGLVVVALVPLIRSMAGGLPNPVLLLCALGGSALITVGYLLSPAVTSALRITSALPALAVVLFLAASPASVLLTSNDPDVTFGDGGDDLPDVAFILFDEFPTMSLLTDDDHIDEIRFPNLAAFAGEATWYRRFTTMAPTTRAAVPSLLTGQEPDGRAALLANFPENLFTMLAPTHDLIDFEAAGTQLCGFPACWSRRQPGATRTDVTGLLGTTWQLFGERLTQPADTELRFDDYAEALVPVDAETDTGDPEEPAESTTRPERHAEFLDTIQSGTPPSLWYLHLIMPHTPWVHYPDGSEYRTLLSPNSHYPFAVANNEGAWIAAFSEQRHLLQAEYADRLFGEVLDTLREQDRYDDALVVFVADHGASFELDTHLRSPSPENLHALAFAPFLVKLPGQTEGRIDDANLMSMDVLPTIADALDIELSARFDGEAATSPAVASRSTEKWLIDLGSVGREPTGDTLTFDTFDDFPSATDRWIGPVPASGDRLAGLHALLGVNDLMGRPLDDLIDGRRGVASLDAPDQIRTPGPYFPPLGSVTGQIQSGSTDGSVLIAIDGAVVSASPVFSFKGRDDVFAGLLPPDTLTRGAAHDLRLAMVDDEGVHELDLEG